MRSSAQQLKLDTACIRGMFNNPVDQIAKVSIVNRAAGSYTCYCESAVDSFVNAAADSTAE
jgi:hypothetical protein